MIRFICATSILLFLMAGVRSQSSGPSDQPRVSPWTVAISGKLCGEGGHPDDIAQQYFDCFQENITPGGSKLVECQDEVYQLLMNTESNVDVGCSSRDKWPEYTSCVERKLVESGYNPSQTLDTLNECQGAVVGVPKP